ncbi:hypothetical protein BLAT2472_80246 [Burkholderia latens]
METFRRAGAAGRCGRNRSADAAHEAATRRHAPGGEHPHAGGCGMRADSAPDAHACASGGAQTLRTAGVRAAGIRRSRQSQISGYPAPKPSRAQPSFCEAVPTVVSV